MVLWHNLAAFLIIGYMAMSRSFAYLGVPQAGIYIGEIVLAAFLLLKPRVAIGTWTTALFRSSPLNALALAMLVFMLYGIWQVFRGVTAGAPLLSALKCFVFTYYILYLFLGLWIGLREPDFLRRAMRGLAWANGIYGLLYIVALKHVALKVPGTPMPLFGQPTGSGFAILGLLCFEANLVKVWPVLLLNTTVLLAGQVRAEWLAFGFATLLWGLLTHRLGKLFGMGLAAVAVLGLIAVTGVQVQGRASTVSAASILGRIVAPIDPEMAQQLGTDVKVEAGTVEWRTKWWHRIWASAQSSAALTAFGHGYGFNLLGLAPPDVRQGQAKDIRTPHSVFFFALGYLGLTGFFLFITLQLSIFQVLWNAFRKSRDPIGVTLWTMGLSMAFFGDFFETPFGAIPFYLLVGIAMAPAFRGGVEDNAYPARAQLLQDAGR